MTNMTQSNVQFKASPKRRAKTGERVVIYLPPDQAKSLRIHAAEENCSLSHAVSEALTVDLARADTWRPDMGERTFRCQSDDARDPDLVVARGLCADYVWLKTTHGLEVKLSKTQALDLIVFIKGNFPGLIDSSL